MENKKEKEPITGNDEVFISKKKLRDKSTFKILILSLVVMIFYLIGTILNYTKTCKVPTSATSYETYIAKSKKSANPQLQYDFNFTPEYVYSREVEDDGFDNVGYSNDDVSLQGYFGLQKNIYDNNYYFENIGNYPFIIGLNNLKDSYNFKLTLKTSLIDDFQAVIYYYDQASRTFKHFNYVSCPEYYQVLTNEIQINFTNYYMSNDNLISLNNLKIDLYGLSNQPFYGMKTNLKSIFYTDSLIENAYDEGYEKGFNDGDAIGYDNGFIDGEDYGYNLGITDADGYNVGYGEGYKEGYNAGDAVGFDKGFIVGEDYGFKDGITHSDGYDKGFIAGRVAGERNNLTLNLNSILNGVYTSVLSFVFTIGGLNFFGISVFDLIGFAAVVLVISALIKFLVK